MRKSLFDHQKKGQEKALKTYSFADGFALFMEMGTGKTLTTLSILESMHDSGLIDGLIITSPKTLQNVWLSEIQDSSEKEYTPFFWDSSKSKTKKYQAQFLEFLSAPMPLFFVNIEAFQIPNNELTKCIIEFCKKRILWAIDESSKIKTPNANRTKSIIKHGGKASKRLILTGTEITNSILDIYSQFCFLDQNFWPQKNFYVFRAKYAVLVNRTLGNGNQFKEVVGFQHTQELLDRIDPYCFRALAKDCLDLPEQIFITVPVELSRPQLQAYSELKQKLMTALESGEVFTVANKISLYTRFRQITGGFLGENELVPINENPKIKTLLDMVEDSSEQIIIFASYLQEVAILKNALSKVGECVVYTGQQSFEERDEAQRKFKAGEARFFIANPDSAGFGLNLQNAHIMIWYSLTTSTEKYWQALKRIHRPGQQDKCRYYYLQATGFVDEKVKAKLDMKEEIKNSFQNGSIEDLIKLV